MLTIILLTTSFVLAVLLLMAARQPDTFSYSRSTLISAPVADIFVRVNNLHNWHDWSPWAKLDPNAKNTFNGPTEGVGAQMTWEGNAKVGTGTMTLIQSRPNELIGFRLDFLKPLASTSTAEFSFSPEGQQTRVVWTMSGHNNFIAKLFGLLVNCEKMLGKQFDQGLANLKQLAEAKR
jgi:Polyketide cyclase / dehydrase and lipid transport